MKRLSYYLIGVSCLAATQLLAVNVPRGSFLELHSCELFAGGCVVSSEATTGGKYMVRAWNFTDGEFCKECLKGMQVAVVEAGSGNLAAENAKGEKAVVYLPQNATPGQRDALVAWLKDNVKDLGGANLQTRITPLEFRKSGTGYSFSAGSFVSVQTAPIESCDTGVCGEALWYTPHGPSSVFAVALDRSSRVTEPLLDLNWTDAGKRSVFLAKFGEANATRNVFVTAADLCGQKGNLF